MTDWRMEARQRIAEKRFPAPRFEAETYPSPESLQERIERQRALFSWAVEQEPQFHVTVQFNDQLDERQVRKRLRLFDALLDRHFLGKHWAHCASEDRTFFLAFIERGNGGLHAHLLLRRPKQVAPMPEWKESLQPRFLSRHFTAQGREKGVCPRGDVLFQRLKSAWDQEQAASYDLKEFQKEWNSRNSFIVSSEFHSTARTAGQDRNAAGRKVHRDGATTPPGIPQRSHASSGLASTAA